jgi:hypothetical protein
MEIRVVSRTGPRFCKGICSALEHNPPVGRKKYESHVFCTRCGTIGNGTWMPKEAMKANGRCPCCNFRPRYKTIHNNKILKCTDCGDLK